MKDEKTLEHPLCLIGGPCKNCIKECRFRKPYSLVKDQEEKEKKNERIFEGNKERN